MKKLILFASLMLSLMGMEARGEVITYIDHEVTGTGTSTVVTEVERTVNTDDADVIYSTEMPNFLNQESGNVELYNKTVVLNDNHVFNNPVVCWGTVNIILCGDYTLNCWAMINVASGHTLNIYVKKGSTGKLVAKGGSNNAGIGSIANVDAGTINIHGGDINATGGYYSAGIGGGYRRGFDNDAAKGGLTVYGGNVTATGGRDGAGIGSGFDEDQTLDARHHAGYITIYGGTVTALGNIACGIGAADNVFGPKFTMYGGTVTATGNYTGAGIGGYLYDSGTIAIYGGTLYANGGYSGGLDEICGAGIGGAHNHPGATVTIMGGTVFAKAGTQENGSGHRAIGAGKGSDDPGVLTIGDAMTVWAGTESDYSGHHFSADQRVGVCHNSQYAKIAVCDHSGSTITIDDGFTHHHDGCIYCSIASGAEQDHVFNDANKCICGLVSLNDDADNDATITTYNTTSQTIALTGRKFYKDNSWNTLCLPFALTSFDGTPLEGATVKSLSSAAFNGSTGTLTLNFSDNLTSIEAGKPYIVKWESTESTETTENTEIVNPVFNNVTIKKSTADVATDVVTFTGIYSPYNISGEDKTMLYMGADNTLYYPNAAMTLNAFRAYFQLNNGLKCGEPSVAGAKGISNFVLNFGDGETTGISNHLNNQTTKQPNDWFTLDGRRLSGKPSRAGVYINNGKKFVIK